MALLDIDHLLSAASTTGATVVSLPGLLTIFGGPLSSSEEIKNGTEPKSSRDACVRWLAQHRTDLHSKLLLPENYDDWSSFNTYSDLLLFEEDLGHLTAAVVIFLEAPGSIAELGAFSQINSLRDRLVIVVTEERHPKKSFISLGPLKQLEERDHQSICVIPSRKPADFHSDINVVIKAVEHTVHKTQQNRPASAFDKLEKQHQFALTLDIISLIEATTFTDIKRAFDYFQVNASDHRIRQILFTLEKAQLIQRRRYGGLDYFCPIQRGEKYIDYRGVTSSEKFNRSRIQARILQSRSASDDKSKVLERAFTEGDKK